MNYHSFNHDGDVFVANTNRKELSNLPAGAYRLAYDERSGTLYFNKFDPKYDTLIDLPSPEYDEVMTEVNTFLTKETRVLFEEYQFLYKRSFILHGLHGTGKTCIVNRVGEKVIQNGGVILFNPNPALLELAFKILDDIQPNRTTMVIFEEFDELLKRHTDTLLSVLDGEVQKNNVMYFATTNHFENIPARLKRPGRFATILEVKYPNLAARTVYLTKKLKKDSPKQIKEWADVTDGLSIDELKETVLSVKCLGKSLNEIVSRIRFTKGDISEEMYRTHKEQGMSSLAKTPIAGPSGLAEAMIKLVEESDGDWGYDSEGN